MKKIKKETRRRSPSDPPSSLRLERNVSAHAHCLNGNTDTGTYMESGEQGATEEQMQVLRYVPTLRPRE